jgi:hypothetical protein
MESLQGVFFWGFLIVFGAMREDFSKVTMHRGDRRPSGRS